MYENKEKNYWTRYNASSSDKRATYLKLIEKFF
jgi:hypothetical protein